MSDYATWLEETGQPDSPEARDRYAAVLASERAASVRAEAWPGRAEVRAWVKTWAA